MGLLEALDFYSTLSEGKNGEQFEYQLYSWGKILPNDVLCYDIEDAISHGLIVARYILRNLPFKLFISNDSLPQKINLTFKAPNEIRGTKKNIHGVFPDEIAQEFAAFLSLVTRRRVFVGNQTRHNDLPIENNVYLYSRSHAQEFQSSKLIDAKEIYQLLNNLQKMDRNIANAFVLAMRLYHSAIDMMYVEPEFSYLFLVTCLESISSGIYKKYRPEKDLDDFLDSRFPGWKRILNIENETEEKQDAVRELLLKNEHFILKRNTPQLAATGIKGIRIQLGLGSALPGSIFMRRRLGCPAACCAWVRRRSFTSRKIKKFIEEYVPEQFWSEETDDAKADDLIGIPDWDRIKREDLGNRLGKVYSARSQLIHEGIRLPTSIVYGHFRRIPILAVDEILNSLSSGSSIPSLLTFEKLVSYSMIEFLRKRKA